MSVETGSCGSGDGDGDGDGGGGGDEMGAWPPGFRFHPTDEELVVYYLKRKMSRKKLKLNIIRDIDVYKWDPEELPGRSILKTGDRQWFFFSPRDRKYPNGARSNRATSQGYWKTTGKDRIITCNSRNVGVKKTLVFYRGRAPSAERTNWVMHEYTLEEAELRRCPNVQDYYALYKLYKKSGAGPKNGEQYGAPFKEEEWADDECCDFNNIVTPDVPVKKHEEVTGFNNVKVDDAAAMLNDFENLINKIADGPAFDLPQNDDYAHILPRVVTDEETHSSLVDPSFREVPMKVLPTGAQPSIRHANFNVDQSTNSNMHFFEAPEVTSTPRSRQPAPSLSEALKSLEEDDDFLEIDELLGPVPTFSDPDNNNVEDLQFDELVNDLFHDAAMFLQDVKPLVHEPISHPCIDLCANNPVLEDEHLFQPLSAENPVDSQLLPYLVVNERDNLLNPQVQLPYPVVNEMDNLLYSQVLNTDNMNIQSWMNDFNSVDFTSVSDNMNLTQHTPGLLHQSIDNISPGACENNSGGDGGGGGGGATGWISSTLWSFVDSIPTNPASAAESPLVNKAFERMSSFSRLRLNVAKSTNIDASNNAAKVRTAKAGRNRMLILVSLFFALCSILWVFLGVVKDVGKSRFL